MTHINVCESTSDSLTEKEQSLNSKHPRASTLCYEFQNNGVSIVS